MTQDATWPVKRITIAVVGAVKVNLQVGSARVGCTYGQIYHIRPALFSIEKKNKQKAL